MPVSAQKTSQNIQPQLLVGLVLMVITLVIGITYIRQNQETRPQALVVQRGGTCTEQCTGNVLRNCTPPEPDGSSEDSGCLWRGRVESCGGQSYCCPNPGGNWTTTMTACATPTPVPTAIPSPTASPSATLSPTATPTAVPSVNPSITPIPSISVSPVPTTTNEKRGDFNDDGVVNVQDVNMLLNVYNRSVTLLPEADLNGDGKIDAIDYAIITDLLGT